RLQRLLDFRNEVPSQGVTARVTGKDASGLFQTFTLDRGESDGVKPGMAVVAPDGAVGRIAQASPHAARVLLVSDHNSGIDALVQRSRARGIVEGALNGACSMKYIKRGDEIDVGDIVVTSGLDGIFPKGIPIGKVTQVTRKDVGLFQIAEVRPAVEFAKLEEVWVISSPPQEVNQAIDDAALAKATPSPDATAAAAAAVTPTPSPQPTPTSRRPAASSATTPTSRRTTTPSLTPRAAAPPSPARKVATPRRTQIPRRTPTSTLSLTPGE
ncbi:MAG: rod shape-determining protein MreC, partial [bacterium]